jgi:mycothiol synthase
MMPVEARPFRPEEDLAALVAVHNAVELAEGREASLTAERLEQSLAVPNLYRWVADTGKAGELAGYGVLFHQNVDRCYFDVKVHPAWRRQGIGRLLVAQIAARAAELKTRWLTIDVPPANQEALRFLLTQGFRYRGDTWALLAPAEAGFPPPVWPPGYAARSYAEVNDLPLFVKVSNRGFGDMWGHWENTPGLVDEAHMSRSLERFDPCGIFLAFDATGAAVGQCRTRAANDDESPAVPHILDEPGIVPEYRAAGLHAPLVLTAARWLQEQGARPIRLESWGDTAETVAVYESLGFTLIEHEVSYVRNLSGGETDTLPAFTEEKGNE